MWENSPSHICRGGDLRGLAFCCPPVKYCPLHKALESIDMPVEEFSKIKQDFGSRTRLGLGKNTCFGSLIWCCKITKPCPFRDSAMLAIDMGEDEYMELKKELAEEIIKKSKLFEEGVKALEEQGISREDAEKAILETGDLKKAYEIVKKQI
ncbi:putative methanogenesis marker domain 9 [Methanococcus maripaludis]|uniref:Putative methanogenesis marker domain 9 n=1 Tax=Methanococcus maripaludis TaxID=39152 RepID=A0A7J9NG26_METMI|nr:methanogenesis marker 9 domain-containing protein [Methanococcus maripaludis]MBA2839507.1 putative methanogenesis marker domain 9 [Methanococcus maripaludis]